MSGITKSRFTSELVFIALISLLFYQVGPSSADIESGPRDTAALDGSHDVALNCTVSQGDSIEWVASVPWSVADWSIYPPKHGAPPNVNFTYSPNGTTLYIKSLNQHLATIYTCKSSVNYESVNSARVAAVEPVKCPSTILAEEGEQVNTSCSVTYYSNSKPPSMPLKATLAAFDENGVKLAEVLATNPGRLDINVTVTATAKMDNKLLTCKIFFDEGANKNLKSTGAAVTTDFENECSFAVQVEHLTTMASIEMAFNNSSNQVNVGDVINCTANGRPDPKYEWFDERNNSLSITSTLEFKDSMASNVPVKYTCIAQNVLMGITGNAEDSIYVTVLKARTEEVKEGMAGWLIAVIVLAVLFVILIVVALILFLCRKKKAASSKPYKPPPKSSKYEPGTTNSLIYTPSRAAPQPSTNAAGVPSPAITAASGIPFARPPLRQSSSPAPPLNNFANNSFPANDHVDDFMPPRSANLIANSGHGDLGMAGLSSSRGSNLNMGSRGNLQDPALGMGKRPENQNLNGNSFSPRNTNPYSGSAEAINFFPMPPPLTVRGQNQESGPAQYYDNMGSNGPKNKKQSQARSPPPPPLAYPSQGLGRQSSLTSNSTNRSVSSDGGRPTGGKGVEKKSKPSKTGGGPKRVASPPGMDETPPRRPPPKKPGVQPVPHLNYGGYPSDAGSLHGSEV